MKHRGLGPAIMTTALECIDLEGAKGESEEEPGLDDCTLHDPLMSRYEAY